MATKSKVTYITQQPFVNHLPHNSIPNKHACVNYIESMRDKINKPYTYITDLFYL